MAELPFHLKTIETLPGALDILRYLGEVDDHTADVDEICDTLELSDRRFSKAIRRLVTKGYVIMDGDMVYRLSEQGEDAVGELSEYDAAEGNAPISVRISDDEDDDEDISIEQNDFVPASALGAIKRRLVLAIPTTFTAHQVSNVVVGFNPASADNTLNASTDMLLRFSVLNGTPQQPKELPLTLSNEAAHETLEVVPGAFTQMRLRVEVMQLDNFSGDISNVGGMYVDVDVSNLGANNGDLIAYGTDISISA
ncbi:MAG: winged helix DNA-binding protein [Aggregatilineales bacterium]